MLEQVLASCIFLLSAPSSALPADAAASVREPAQSCSCEAETLIVKGDKTKKSETEYEDDKTEAPTPQGASFKTSSVNSSDPEVVVPPPPLPSPPLIPVIPAPPAPPKNPVVPSQNVSAKESGKVNENGKAAMPFTSPAKKLQPPAPANKQQPAQTEEEPNSSGRCGGKPHNNKN